jgi:hypothetical protein
MSTITVTTACGTTRTFDSRRDGEEGKRTQASLCRERSERTVEISVESEQSPPEPVMEDDGETDHEYAEFEATAWRKREPEQVYTGHATARASEGRRGVENNRNELAETRAMKRAVAWASGVGLLARAEMLEYVEEEGQRLDRRSTEARHRRRKPTDCERIFGSKRQTL